MAEWNTDFPIKAAFFDVDGTLLSHRTHRVPESSYEALRALKNKGILTILATGRPTYMLDILDTSLFDAFVIINGQYCFVGDEVIYSNPIDKVDIKTMVSQVKQGVYACQFQELDRCYVDAHTDRVRAMEQFVNQKYEDVDITRALSHDVYQVNAYLHPGEEHLLVDACPHIKIARWADLFVDVMPLIGGKSLGIKKMIEHLHIDSENTICFGDGGNDVGMFSVCGTPIAMGNAQDELKQLATFITDDVDNNGIYNACVRMGFI